MFGRPHESRPRRNVAFTRCDFEERREAAGRSELGRRERDILPANRLQQSRDVWLTLLREGVSSGALRKDLDVELVYRFIRDTVWVAVRWYHPGGPLTHEDIADQYLTILLDGISNA